MDKLSKFISYYRKKYPNDYIIEDADIIQEVEISAFRRKYYSTFDIERQLDRLHRNCGNDLDILSINNLDNNYENLYVADKLDNIDNTVDLIKRFEKVAETITSRQLFVIILRYGLSIEKYVSDKSIKSYMYTEIANHLRAIQHWNKDKLFDRTDVKLAYFTYAEVGIIFDVTDDRIRQIEAKAFERLKHPSRLGKVVGGVI